jgi:hypothetical protein
MARHLGLTIHQSKEGLINSIFANQQETEILNSIYTDEQSNRSFIKNGNTIPRLLNCLINYPDQLAVSRLLANRSAIQNRVLNENNPVYIEACKLFNDYSVSTGGLLSQHHSYTTNRINPDAVNTTGELTNRRAYELLKNLMIKYADVYRRLNLSGQHGTDIFEFTKDTDVIYCYYWLNHLNNPQLTIFFTEGNQTPYTYESEIISNDSQDASMSDIELNTPSTPLSDCSSKKRKSEVTLLIEAIERNRIIREQNESNERERSERERSERDKNLNVMHPLEEIERLTRINESLIKLIENMNPTNPQYEILKEQLGNVNERISKKWGEMKYSDDL